MYFFTLYYSGSDSDSDFHTAMATNSRPRESRQIWCNFTEKVIVQRNIIFVRSLFLSKEEIYSTLPAMYVGRIQQIVFPLDILRPVHSPAGNETRDTKPDDPETVLPI